MNLTVAFGAGIVVGVAGMVGGLALAGPVTDPVEMSPQAMSTSIEVPRKGDIRAVAEKSWQLLDDQ